MENSSFTDKAGPHYPLSDQQSIESKTRTSIGGSESGETSTDELEMPVQQLANLQRFLKSEIPEEPSVQFLSDAAHELIEKLNTKRKVDTLLLEQFKQAMETQTAKLVEEMEQQMYNSYESLNLKVDEKLKELFSSVNRISSAEGELENFRESLRLLYQELQNE